MRYTPVILSVVLLITCKLLYAQDKVYELVDKSMNPVEIQLLGTGTDELIIHYLTHNKVPGSDAKAYYSCLIFPSKPKPNRLTLPYSLDIKGIGYTNEFYTLVGTHRDRRTVVQYGRVTVFKIEKQGLLVRRQLEVNLDDEDNRFIFSEGGVIFVITSIKKGPSIRIRRIADLEVEIFDFPMTKDQIRFWRSKAVYVPLVQSDPIPADFDLKVFIRDGHVVIADRNPKAPRDEAMLTFHEFSLTNPSTFTSRPINPPGSRDRLAFTPHEDKVLLYETAGRTAMIHIVDFKTLKILKSFSTDELDSPMLAGDLYKTGAYGEYDEKRKDGEGTVERKLNLITRLRPWIQTWPLDDTHLKVSFGDYTMSGTLKEFNYLNLVLDPVTFEASKDNPVTSRRQFLMNFLYGEKGANVYMFSTHCTSENCYALKFGFASSTLTVWK